MTGGTELILWVAVCSRGGTYAAVFNAGEKASETEISLAELEIYDPVSAAELWSGERQEATDRLKIKLSPHDAAAFIILPA